MEIFFKDIKTLKELTYDGDTLKQKRFNEMTGRYLYERYHNGRLLGYEIVQPVKHKNPDGTTVYSYPSTGQFGKNGWFLPSTCDNLDIRYYLESHNKGLARAEWKRSLK